MRVTRQEPSLNPHLQVTVMHRLIVPAVRRRTLWIIAVLGCIPSANSSVPARERGAEATRLYPVCVENTWGYIDDEGDFVIAPRFASAHPFSEGLALAYLKESHGEPHYIDSEGDIVFRAPVKHNLTTFSQGFASGSDGQRSFHFDRHGRLLPQHGLHWRHVGPFSEGLAAVDIGSQEEGLDMIPDQKWGFIDRSGKLVVPCQHFAVKRFSNGLAPVCVNAPWGLTESRWGYINRKGEMLIEPQFDDAWPFSEGVALVLNFRDEELNERLGHVVDRFAYINAEGEFVIPPREYDRDLASSFHEGLAAVGGLNRAALDPTPAFIDKHGEEVITGDRRVDYFEDFSEGLAAARERTTGKFGYVDRKGHWAIRAQFDKAGRFVGPLARVSIKHRFGYINREGKRVWWQRSTSD
jgi:hypothetical protein